MTARANAQQKAVYGLCRRDLRAFLHKSFLVLNTGQTYVRTWHIDALVHALERVRLGQIRRLIINMPPRSLKSMATSVAFPAFALGHDPTRRIICVSYSGDLARKHSNDFRALIQSEGYRHIFPHVRIGDFKNTENEIELTQRGFRMATSVGGTLTGRGGDVIIIDDPLKPDDALSETRREAANQWFSNTLLSRLDDKRTGAIIVVMQRVHMDDLTGFLMSHSDEWELLCLPAIAEYEEEIPIAPGLFHKRKAGEALSPQREPLRVLEDLKRQIGSDAFSAQYQQAPVPPGGAMIKRQWIKRYSEPPQRSNGSFLLQSWDTASKGGPDNDWSVCTTWVVKGQHRYLVHVFRQRLDYPALKASVLRLAAVWKPARVLVEDAGAGTSLVQELKHRVSGIIAVKPTGDKVSRMAVVSAQFEAGQVHLPERAPWLSDFEAELFAFPGSRHDDQCDSVSQALSNSNQSWLKLITPAVLAKSKIRRPLVQRVMVSDTNDL